MNRIPFILLAAFSLALSSFAEEAYLFSYFSNKDFGGRRGEAAGLHLAYSYDGKTWTALNGDEPLLVPEIGKDKLMRDPSICRGPDGTFHMVWTSSWKDRIIGYASSKDLVHWSEQKAIPVMADEPTARNCWAPELTYNPDDGLFYIYWATTIPGRHSAIGGMDKKENGLNHRIYLTTTKDFKTFSPTKLWFNPDFSAIDAAVVRDPKAKDWIMVVKNENHTPAEKNIRVTRTADLAKGFPTTVSAKISPDWVEGPTPLWVGDSLYVYFDCYTKHRFGAVRSDDHGQTWTDVSSEVSFPKDIRHGTAFAVDKAFVDALDKTPNRVTVDPKTVRFPVAEDMWGIFFEDIDLSLDGGVYAELVRNGSFQEDRIDKWHKGLPLASWTHLGAADMTVDTSRPLSEKNDRSVKVVAKPGAGLANQGFFGIAAKAGATYDLTLMARGDTDLEVSLECLASGKVAAAKISGLTDDWREFKVSLTATATDPQCSLAIRSAKGGTFYLDCISLFPRETYGKSGLFRKDLMEKLAALKPSFVRFPGGCWVEGNTMAEAYRWKQTIGSRWERRTQWNIWKYWSTNAVGFHEYLLLCEELGAKALFCINVGMSHRETVPMEKMDEFVQDALDCLEYANGPADSKWGAVRAAAGHPEPFNLAYLEIGNENGGKDYEERYALMAKAVRAKYPDVKLIFNNWRSTKDVDAPKDLRDDHDYHDPDWFIWNNKRYTDRKFYDGRNGDFGIFVGEYAVTQDTRRWGSLRAAIGEAAYMAGLENCADVVKMAAYAPLFANCEHTVWTPNMIYVSTDSSFVNPSWSVQKLFSENRGKEVLSCQVMTETFTSKDGKNPNMEAITASAVRDANGDIVVKLVNASWDARTVSLNLQGKAVQTVFGGGEEYDSNSLFEPEALKESVREVTLDGSALVLPKLSLTVLRFKTLL